MKESKLLTVLLAIAAALTILAGSIAVPILCRPFYYAQIDSLNLVEDTGLTEDEIKTAYNEMVDFCIGAQDDFSVGVLPWSESGESHFEDVKVLFILDFVLLGCGAAAVVVILIIKRLLHIKFSPILRRGPGFWGGAVLGVAFLVIGGYAATDFDRFFTVFHHVFFPGKGNWLFDPATDPVIELLPEVFFRNCAILIVVILIAACVILILTDFRIFPTKSRQKKIEEQ
ncbi:MAG: TIGR01906 family membrane protein [Lachnospiraceae bacterium]|nr:TIGR01906 family membrane protein [Lachnospiraceae bacterium]